MAYQQWLKWTSLSITMIVTRRGVYDNAILITFLTTQFLTTLQIHLAIIKLWWTQIAQLLDWNMFSTKPLHKYLRISKTSKQFDCMSDSQVIKINPIYCNHETSFKLTGNKIKTAKRAFTAIQQLIPHGGCLMEYNFSNINMYSAEKCNSGNRCLPNDLLIESDIILRRSRMEP